MEKQAKNDCCSGPEYDFNLKGLKTTETYKIVKENGTSLIWILRFIVRSSNEVGSIWLHAACMHTTLSSRCGQ